MPTINSYLKFDGNCEEAFNHYKSIFGGEFMYFGRFDEMPKSTDYSISEKDLNKVMHVSLPIGNSILMGSDKGGDWGPKFIEGNNFAVSVSPQSKEEADELFSKLSEGGNISTPIHQAFWGSYFGELTDKFGVNWMVNFSM